MSRVRVCEVLATFWQVQMWFADLSSAWNGKERGQERCEMEVGGPDYMRWAGLGEGGWAYDR